MCLNEVPNIVSGEAKSLSPVNHHYKRILEAIIALSQWQFLQRSSCISLTLPLRGSSMGAQAKPRVRASFKNAKPNSFTIKTGWAGGVVKQKGGGMKNG